MNVNVSGCKSVSSRFWDFHCIYFVLVYFLEGEVYGGEFVLVWLMLLKWFVVKKW